MPLFVRALTNTLSHDILQLRGRAETVGTSLVGSIVAWHQS